MNKAMWRVLTVALDEMLSTWKYARWVAPGFARNIPRWCDDETGEPIDDDYPEGIENNSWEAKIDAECAIKIMINRANNMRFDAKGELEVDP